MSARYTALNSRADRDAQHDMEAAFDYTEDDDDDIHDSHESHPLNPTPTSPSIIQAPSPNSHPPRVPGTYDFENVDYDYPPPGSPPRPSAIALPNDYGNSNGLVPQIPDGGLTPRQSWLRRTAVSMLPNRFARSMGLSHERPQGAIGGGTLNDGVFANVTAKPTRPVTVREGDDTFIVPEETRSEAPPSYASAQADAVPPYWETTVHAPFTPGAVGDIIVDNLPTGSLFSFLWNMLVSISFQFVGFLLTYLLHTTHAAKLGSRAGLGVTLIQYGFALRGQLDNPNGADQDEIWGNWGQVPRPTTTEGTSSYTSRSMNSTVYASTTEMAEEQANSILVGATTEWISFLLMTIGASCWFILLTSLLGFWRVKRWEKSILASQRDSAPVVETTSSSLFSRVENSFSLRGSSRLDFFRTGFGLGRRQGGDTDDETTRAAVRAEEGIAHPRNDDEHALETDAMISADPDASNRSRLVREALEHDRRLFSIQDFGDAGKSAENLHEYGELIGLTYAIPYLKLPTTWGFVLIDETKNETVGYALGTKDTRAYEKYASEHWWPVLAEKYPPSMAKMPGDVHYTNLFRNMHTAPDANVAFAAAHLHIDILEEYQGQGWGRKLISTAIEYLKGEKITGEGVWLGMDPRNIKARGFYLKLGFKRIEGADENQFGIKFAEYVGHAAES
ncbi:hypothetical protein C0992_007785 [Termitomyces sp. T32_za158]|nr:hypothetical protein C0992_007785 [Termitomyces sp. T32_za158]